MTKKSSLDRRRDAAFSLQIKARGQDHATYIVEMFAIDGRQYAFKEDSVFLVQTPDDIDPERKYPHTKGSTTQVYKMGTRHPIVSRTIIQAKRILDSVSFSGEISKDEIIYAYFRFFRELAICNTVYEKLAKECVAKLSDVDKMIQTSSNSQFVGDIPQILNLEDRVRGFFLTGHKALRELSSATDLFFPTKPKLQNFTQLKRWLLENLGENNPIYLVMHADQGWLTLFWEIRNAIEHPNSPKYNFDVRNIEMAPNGKFYPPRWRYTVPGRQQNDYTNLLTDVEAYMLNIISFGEELLILCVRETWNKNIPFAMVKRPPEKLDPRCPIQYEVTIDLERLQQRR